MHMAFTEEDTAHTLAYIQALTLADTCMVHTGTHMCTHRHTLAHRLTHIHTLSRVRP